MQKFSSYKEITNLVKDDFSQMLELTRQTAEITGKENVEFQKSIDAYLNGNSKYLRSCLIFLFSRLLFGKVDENIIKLAASVEVIHNATLIHDDIIDEAEKRRGKTALHKEYGNHLSVITGDFLLSLAIKMLNSIQKNVVIEIFANCLVSLCQGEMSQYFSQKSTPSVEIYLKKSQAKTSSLFLAGLSSLAEIKNSQYKTDMENFATNFGIAFQIQDDLNNFTDEKTLKPLLLDINKGIYTAPVIFAFGENKDLTSYTAEQIYNESIKPENIKKTRELIEKQIQKAVNSIKTLSENAYKSAIVDLCNIICK